MKLIRTAIIIIIAIAVFCFFGWKWGYLQFQLPSSTDETPTNRHYNDLVVSDS